MNKLLHLLFRRRQLDADMTDEMRAHLDAQTQRNVASGMSPDDARAAAHRQFGGVAQIQERARDVLVIRCVDELRRNVKFGVRALRRSPEFTVVTTLTIALGSAAVALVGLFFDAIVWRDLPHVRVPERVVEVLSHDQKHPWNIAPVSGPVFLEWKERSQSFESIAAYTHRGDTLAAGDLREFKGGLLVDPELFAVLDVTPARGRTFTSEDARSASPRTVIISDAVWMQFFQRRPEAVGSPLRIGNNEHTVIGVMPPRFEFPHSKDYWLPLVWEGAAFSDRKLRRFEVVARLRAGVSVVEASAEMAALAEAQAQHAPDTDGLSSARVMPAWERITISFRHDVQMFFVAVLTLQLLVSLNVGGLLFSRFVRRAPETAMRAALGATRTRLMREMLTESLVLAVAGLVAGLLLAYWVRPFAIAAVTPDYPFPRAFTFEFNSGVTALTALVTCGTMLAAGLLPAWRHTRLPLADGVRGGAMTIGGKPRQTRARSFAVVVQVSGTFALLVYCGLRLEEVRALRRTDLGVDPRGVAMLSIASPHPRSSQESASFATRLLFELRQTPGLDAVALGTGMPGQFEYPRAQIAIEGQAIDPAQQPRLTVRAISPGMLELLRIPLLRGRDFTERDAISGERVALIDRVAAEKLFPQENPLGQRIATDSTAAGAPQWATIVGIVAPTQQFTQLHGPGPTIYTNWFSSPTPVLPVLYVRADQHPRLTLDAAIGAIRRFDPEAAVLTPAQGIYARQIAASYWNFTWRGNVMATFASVAHLVAAIGIFGIVAYTVAERRREIGIRQALGATQNAVVREFAWRGFRLILGGSVLGLIVTLVLTRALPLFGKSLYKTNPHDAAVYAGVAAALLFAGLLASWLPARRAAKIDPVVALRAE